MDNQRESKTTESRFKAALLGGALGDALGYAVEFMSLTEIYSKYGGRGINQLQVDKRIGKALISDDTQMTLFTADGLLWSSASVNRNKPETANEIAVKGLYPSYLRWYSTQQGTMPLEQHQLLMDKQPHEVQFSLLDEPGLFARRAPGNTCISALASGVMGTIEHPLNQSKGCGGVMRVGPIGLMLHQDPAKAFQTAARAAAITHGHASGYLAAGAFSAMVAELINGKEMIEGVETALALLGEYRHHDETSRAIERAVNYAKSSERTENAIVELGEGWVAEEALAIGLYCAMKRRDFKAALIMSVNHSGDSDSTGSIAGTLLGAYGGLDVIPEDWLQVLEMKDVIEAMGTRLAEV